MADGIESIVCSICRKVHTVRWEKKNSTMPSINLSIESTGKRTIINARYVSDTCSASLRWWLLRLKETCKQYEKKNSEASLSVILSFFFCHPFVSMKKRFHIPPSYTFVSEYGNAATVLSLAPFVSSCSSPLDHVGGLRPFYQQQKFLLNASTRCSSPSSDTATIHSTDDALFETPPSTNSSLGETSSGTNPFENQVWQSISSIWSIVDLLVVLGQAIITCSKSFHSRQIKSIEVRHGNQSETSADRWCKWSTRKTFEQWSVFVSRSNEWFKNIWDTERNKSLMDGIWFIRKEKWKSIDGKLKRTALSSIHWKSSTPSK